MFLRLVVLFVAVPLAELALLVWVGGYIGVLPTVALVVVTGFVGAALARQQGLRTLERFQASLATGRPPHRELLEGVLILLAAAVLLTPGLLTDVAGFVLLVPAARQALGRRLGRWVERRLVVVGADRSRRPGEATVVDAEYTVREDPGLAEPPPGERDGSGEG